MSSSTQKPVHEKNLMLNDFLMTENKDYYNNWADLMPELINQLDLFTVQGRKVIEAMQGQDAQHKLADILLNARLEQISGGIRLLMQQGN